MDRLHASGIMAEDPFAFLVVFRLPDSDRIQPFRGRQKPLFELLPSFFVRFRVDRPDAPQEGPGAFYQRGVAFLGRLERQAVGFGSLGLQFDAGEAAELREKLRLLLAEGMPLGEWQSPLQSVFIYIENNPALAAVFDMPPFVLGQKDEVLLPRRLRVDRGEGDRHPRRVQPAGDLLVVIWKNKQVGQGERLVEFLLGPRPLGGV